MIGKFKEKWVEKHDGSIPKKSLLSEVETDHPSEDKTIDGGGPFEILHPQELEEMRLKEQEAQRKIPDIEQQAYDELEKAMQEGEEENAWEVKKSLIKEFTVAKPVEVLPPIKETLFSRVKKLLRF